VSKSRIGPDYQDRHFSLRLKFIVRNRASIVYQSVITQGTLS